MRNHRIIFIIFFIIFALPCSAQSKRILGDSWFGCISKEQHGKMISMIVAGDREAFSKELLKSLMSGQCIRFRAGQVVQIEDTALFSGMIKLRPAGSTEGYWTNVEAAK